MACCGARDKERARSFAGLHGIPAHFGSYEEVCRSEDVDVVYVASLHPDHKAHAEMALECGKHVLVEKPMGMNADEAETIYRLGAAKGLFVGEGMWTRFMPAVEMARSALPSLGACKLVQADFCIDGADVGPYPADTIYQSALGGGAATILGPYVVGAAMMPFGKGPDIVAAAGKRADDSTVGELSGGAVLTFRGSPGEGGSGGSGGLATVVAAFTAESAELTTYSCEGGRITLQPPAHCPTEVTVSRKRGRGEAASPPSTTSFPLPPMSAEVEAAGGFFMPNSTGFIYEAEALRRLVFAGRLTFPQWSPEESVACLRTVETIKAQAAAVASSAPVAAYGAETVRLQHVVSVRIDDAAAASGFDGALRGLAQHCAPLELSVEGGPNVSREGKSRGLTHTYVITFPAADHEAAEGALAAYLEHSAHTELSKRFGPFISDVAVSDFFA